MGVPGGPRGVPGESLGGVRGVPGVPRGAPGGPRSVPRGIPGILGGSGDVPGIPGFLCIKMIP